MKYILYSLLAGMTALGQAETNPESPDPMTTCDLGATAPDCSEQRVGSSCTTENQTQGICVFTVKRVNYWDCECLASE